MNNPPAFPHSHTIYSHGQPSYEDSDYADGMTLRDYFAAQVIAAIYRQSVGKELGQEYMANCAYILADAMLKAREQ